MIPASNATLASTIPGPPRALVVIARLIRSNPRNPAKRPASDTERILTTQLPTMKAAIIDNDTPRTRSSFNPTIAKYAGIKNANDTFPMASSASENQSCEAGVEYLQVGENLRNNRNRRYGDPDGENDDQRNAIAARTGERGANKPWTQHKPKDEWYARTHDGQPTHFAALFASEQLAGFRPRQEHQ